jgi:hypothetical protein
LQQQKRIAAAFILQQQNVMLQNAELNACPHACFAAYALPAADRATPCSPFRGTHVMCLHRGLVFSKLKNFKVEANVCKKDWNTVPIYSQHLVFFLSFVGGCQCVLLCFSLLGVFQN